MFKWNHNDREGQPLDYTDLPQDGAVCIIKKGKRQPYQYHMARYNAKLGMFVSVIDGHVYTDILSWYQLNEQDLQLGHDCIHENEQYIVRCKAKDTYSYHLATYKDQKWVSELPEWSFNNVIDYQLLPKEVEA